MQRRHFMRLGAQLTAGVSLLPLLQACGGGDDVEPLPPEPRNAYTQANLAASNGSFGAPFVLPDMVNAWGIAIRPAGVGGHFWVLGGGTSWQFLGDVSASPDPALRPLTQDGLSEVYLPGADALSTEDSLGKATGTAFNGAPLDSRLFRVTTQTAQTPDGRVELDGSARFVFVTDSGQISAWTERARDTGATVRVNGSAPLVYDGSALGMAFFGVALRTDTWDTLWAADFGLTPQIRQFDSDWNLVPTRGFANPFATGPLLDPANPSQGRTARPGEPVPFNIQVLGDRVFVPYAISLPLSDSDGRILDPGRTMPGEEDALDAEEEARAGGRPNRGKVVEYTLTGELVRVYEDEGRLNAPWGVALAPANFGPFSNTLLVGNFGGAGKILAFDRNTGRFIDHLRDGAGQVIGIDGLWALQFGNGASLGDANALYFSAGPEEETLGLFGSLRHLA